MTRLDEREREKAAYATGRLDTCADNTKQHTHARHRQHHTPFDQILQTVTFWLKTLTEIYGFHNAARNEAFHSSSPFLTPTATTKI